MGPDIRTYFDVGAFKKDFANYKVRQKITVIQLAENSKIPLKTLRGLMQDDTWHEIKLITFLKICEATDLSPEKVYQTMNEETAIEIAIKEADRISAWVREYPGVCVYCAEDAESRDHLVPEPWTGKIARERVPTVPACMDCNNRVNDAWSFTIAGRCDIIAISLRKRFKKDLIIEDHSEEWFKELGSHLATILRQKQERRRILKRRLAILDYYGAPNINFDLLRNGVILSFQDSAVCLSADSAPKNVTTDSEAATEPPSYLRIDLDFKRWTQ